MLELLLDLVVTAAMASGSAVDSGKVVYERCDRIVRNVLEAIEAGTRG